MVTCYWVTPLRAAGDQCISISARWTSTHSQMSLCLALGSCSTLTTAGINTLVVDTCLMIGTFTVALAFTPDTIGESISCISWGTSTNRPFTIGAIVTRGAYRICTTWVWNAQILLCEWTTAYEWIARHISWTAAYWCESAKVTVRIHSA